MTRERQDILEDFYVGTHKNIRDTVYDKDGALQDLTNFEITFFLLDERTGSVYITKSSSNVAEIQILDQVSNKGELIVYLVPSDTLRINDDDLYGTFRYHVHALDDSGYATIVTTGQINIFPTSAVGRARNDSIPAYLEGQ